MLDRIIATFRRPVVGAVLGTALVPAGAEAIELDAQRIGDPVSGYAATSVATVNPVIAQLRGTFYPGDSAQASESMFGVTGSSNTTASSVGASAKSTSGNILLGGGANASLFDPYTLLGNSTGSPIPLNFNFGINGRITLQTDLTVKGYNLATANYSNSVSLFTDQGYTHNDGSITQEMLNGVIILNAVSGDVSSQGLLKADLGAEVEVKLGDVKLITLSFTVPILKPEDISVTLQANEIDQFSAALQDASKAAVIEAKSGLTASQLQDAQRNGELSFELGKLDFSTQTGFSVPGVTFSGGEIDLGATAQASVIGSGSAEADYLDPFELLSVSVPSDYSGSVAGLSVRLSGGQTFTVFREGNVSVDVPEPRSIWLLGPLMGMVLAVPRFRRS